MHTGKRKKNRNSIARAVFVALSLLLQIGWILLMILELNNYSAYIALFTNIIASIAVLRLYSKHTTSAYKMPWIMIIMALPVMGLSLYLLTEVALTPKSIHKRMKAIRAETTTLLQQDPEIQTVLEEKSLSAANQCRYLHSFDSSPVYRNTDTVYYGDCARIFEKMKEDLESARDFIFMEYFIVEDGESFQELRDILVRKAAEGVDVRLLYDDIGSIGKANWQFARELNDQGIRCKVFNPALPFLNVFLNNRDHRKITVIDGKVGYTGGYNLADEYFGRVHPTVYGRTPASAWKVRRCGA